jgi:hypothetical protein
VTDSDTASAPVRFDTRLVVLVRDDLQPWQELNVTAFLASGVSAGPDMLGEPYVDADGTEYLPLLRQPVLVYQADLATLRSVREKAVARALRVAIYDGGMFATGHDAANREVVAAKAGGELDLVGLALHGPKNAVDRVTKGVPRHP